MTALQNAFALLFATGLSMKPVCYWQLTERKNGRKLTPRVHFRERAGRQNKPKLPKNYLIGQSGERRKSR